METDPNKSAHELHHQIRRGISNTTLPIIPQCFNLYTTQEVTGS